MKERISVTEYNAKDGWTRKEYTIRSENGVFNKKSTDYSDSSESSSLGASDDILTLAVSGMLLASLVVIVIIWIVAFRSKSNLYLLATLLTFGILGWDLFVIFISADSFGEVLSKGRNSKAKRRQKYRDIYK